MQKIFLAAMVLGIVMLMAGGAFANPVLYYPSIIASTTEPSPGRANYLDKQGHLVGYSQANQSGRVDYYDGGSQLIGHSDPK